MKTLIKNKVTLGTILAFIVVMFIYNTFFKVTDVETTSGATAVSVGDDLLKINSELQKVSLERTIFSTSAYQGLIDYSAAIPEQPTGRKNPFNTIGKE